MAEALLSVTAQLHTPPLPATHVGVGTGLDTGPKNTLLPAHIGVLTCRVRLRVAPAWLSRMIAVESLCCRSRRVSATLACARATVTTAFLRRLLPFCLRGRSCCSRLSLRAARRRTAKCVSPRSIPTSDSQGDNGSSLVCTTNEAKYLSAESRITVTDDGSAGRGAGPAHGHIADLRQPQPAVVEHCEPGVAGEADGLPIVLAGSEPGRGDGRAFACAGDRREEVAVSHVQVSECLLQHHRGHLAEPSSFWGALGLGDDLLGEVSVQQVRQPGITLPDPPRYQGPYRPARD